MQRVHFINSGLKDIPEQLRSLETQTEEINMGGLDLFVQLIMILLSPVPTPDEKAHVFIRVKENIGEYIVDPNEE